MLRVIGGWYIMGIKGKVIIMFLVLSLISSGALAGTFIKSYQTVRGDYAIVENEEVHKNRIAITVNGQKMNQATWYLIPSLMHH